MSGDPFPTSEELKYMRDGTRLRHVSTQSGLYMMSRPIQEQEELWATAGGYQTFSEWREENARFARWTIRDNLRGEELRALRRVEVSL